MRDGMVGIGIGVSHHHCCASIECGWVEMDYFGSLSAVSPWGSSPAATAAISPMEFGLILSSWTRSPLRSWTLVISYSGKKSVVSPFLFFLTCGIFKSEQNQEEIFDHLRFSYLYLLIVRS